MTKDEEAIRTVLQHYHEGLHRCDTALLKEVFHENALYFTASGGEILQLTMDAYLPRVAARTPPRDLGEPCRYEIDTLEMAGPVTAFARVRSSMWGKNFIDLLTLVFVDGTWKVIAKVFHHEDDPDAQGGTTWS